MVTQLKKQIFFKENFQRNFKLIKIKFSKIMTLFNKQLTGHQHKVFITRQDMRVALCILILC